MLKAKSKQTYDEFYVDFDTKNDSFIKMAVMLNEKGIKNFAFFLKIYNKKLVGYNPYDEHLPREIKAQMFTECAENRWYFYREVMRVDDGGSTAVGGGTEFLLNRGNLAFLWARELNLNVYQIMPRQFGKTWGAIADLVHSYHFKQNMTTLHFNKNQGDANANLRRIKGAIAMLPIWMQHSSDENMSSKAKKDTKDNEKEMRNTLNSSILAMQSAGNESKADAMARGKTAALIWYDEIAFIFFNKAIYEAATPAFEKARENAIKYDMPHGIIITTTRLGSPDWKLSGENSVNCWDKLDKPIVLMCAA